MEQYGWNEPSPLTNPSMNPGKGLKGMTLHALEYLEVMHVFLMIIRLSSLTRQSCNSGWIDFHKQCRGRHGRQMRTWSSPSNNHGIALERRIIIWYFGVEAVCSSANLAGRMLRCSQMSSGLVLCLLFPKQKNWHARGTSNTETGQIFMNSPIKRMWRMKVVPLIIVANCSWKNMREGYNELRNHILLWWGRTWSR